MFGRSLNVLSFSSQAFDALDDNERERLKRERRRLQEQRRRIK